MSDSLKQLKERISQEDGNVEQLLEELGCDNVKRKEGRSGDDLVTARLPDSQNSRSVQIYINPNLNSYIVNRGIEGDIYSIVGYILYDCQTFDHVREHLYQIKTYICNTLGYENIGNDFADKPVPKTDWNWWLRDIQKQRKREIEITENHVLDPIVLNQFVHYPWLGWVHEGLSIRTQQEFGICYDLQTERVIIPVHNQYGQLIGAKGRYYGLDTRVIDEFGQKYIYVIPCSKSIELFNLFRALPYIKEKKQVFIVEGAKTTMFLWEWGIKNAVSIEGDRLSPVQAMLLKGIGLDIDLIFAWDKGKSKDFIEKQIKQIKNRNVYYLLDNPDGIPDIDRFKDKQSPTDNGYRIFMDLLENDIYKYT
ncbi:DNA primase [Paenibacillus cremeus]|uniref:DNA primase n=1 Tax=Paenibacillus cremeus TaxID=2163881 RepID=A0A559KCN7_9BACL|nr:DNA primase [Paenibacillus cremeus]TVY09859.1 DNA primase [Paenibacillus cremeus]